MCITSPQMFRGVIKYGQNHDHYHGSDVGGDS